MKSHTHTIPDEDFARILALYNLLTKPEKSEKYECPFCGQNLNDPGLFRVRDTVFILDIVENGEYSVVRIWCSCGRCLREESSRDGFKITEW